MIKSVVWFACGGLYTACFNNAARNFPVFKKPSRHILFTLIGAGIGYQFYLFEESGPERYKELIKQHKNAPWFEKGVLLARREARMKAQKGGNEETENALADEFIDIEDDDE